MLGFDSVWFGMLLVVMKCVAPPEVTIQEICWVVLPNIIFDVMVIAMIIMWPSLTLWLPGFLA
jgi:TRAP-type mannitol/chloroaromatic compound transport system permease large subunit